MYRSGLLYALGAYGLWGLLPIYWKLLVDVPAIEILFHRMAWSLLFLGSLLLVGGKFRGLLPVLKQRRVLLVYLLASVLLSANWGVYIWAVNSGFIVETSLGYFINPLMSVALGVLFFKETLRKAQWVAIVLAIFGVLVLTWAYGKPPWISLFLATSFATYGVIKKVAKLGAIEGLAIETAWMFFPAVGFLVYWHTLGTGSFLKLGLEVDFWLACSGVATALPLLFFAAAATRLPLSIVGVMQYIAPSIQFCLGVFVYGEAFGTQRLLGFLFIWSALAVFSIESYSNRNKPATQQPA